MSWECADGNHEDGGGPPPEFWAGPLLPLALGIALALFVKGFQWGWSLFMGGW